MLPVRDEQRRKKYNQFINFAVIFTYAPVIFIFYGLIVTNFDVMSVLDGSTIYTVMMGITLMFGYIMMTGSAIARLIYLFLQAGNPPIKKSD